MANFAKVKCQFLKKNKRKEKANLVKKKKMATKIFWADQSYQKFNLISLYFY